MMRFLALSIMLFSGCASECFVETVWEEPSRPLFAVANAGRATMVWFDSGYFVATLKRTGELSEPRALPMVPAKIAAAGLRTAVTIGVDAAGAAQAVMLVSDEAITPLALPNALRQPRVSFDGTQYQLVGHDDAGGLHVVSLDEDGVYGNDTRLTPTVNAPTAKLDVVSDRAGNTIVFHADNTNYFATRLTATREALWTVPVPKYAWGQPVWLPADGGVWVPDTSPVQLTDDGGIVAPPFSSYPDRLLPGLDALHGGVPDYDQPDPTSSSAGDRRIVARFDPQTGTTTPLGATFVGDAVGMGDRIAAFEMSHEPARIHVRLYALDGSTLVEHTVAVGPPARDVRVCSYEQDGDDGSSDD